MNDIKYEDTKIPKPGKDPWAPGGRKGVAVRIGAESAVGFSRTEALERLALSLSDRAVEPKFVWSADNKALFVVRGFADGVFGYEIVSQGVTRGSACLGATSFDQALRDAERHAAQWTLPDAA